MSRMERAQAGTDGLNLEAAPDALTPTQAAVLTNLLPGRPGKTVMRGGIYEPAARVAADTLVGTVWTSLQAVLANTTGGNLKTWSLYDDPALTTSSTMAAGGLTLRRPFTALGDDAYGTVLDTLDPNAPVLIAKWVPFETFAKVNNSPKFVVDVATHLRRLFTVGGTDPTIANPTAKQIFTARRTLHWSDIGGPTGTLASWQDDVSGLLNQLVLDMPDRPVALARTGRFLAILGERTIQLLTGDTPASFAVRTLTREYGCLSSRSVVEVEDGFYFMSERGYCYCDGASVRVVSAPIQTRLLSRSPTALGRCSATMMRDGHIGVCFDDSTASFQDMTIYLMRLDNGAWSTHTTGLMDFLDAFCLERAADIPFLYTGGRPLQLQDLTAPERTVLHIGSGTESVGYGLYDRGVNGTIKNWIFAEWQSRSIKLASPMRQSMIRRAALDSIMDMNPLGSSAGYAWLTSLFKDDGTVLLQFGGAYTSPAVDAKRQRWIKNVNIEASEVFFRATFTGIGAADMWPIKAELFDAWVEFEPAQER